MTANDSQEEAVAGRSQEQAIRAEMDPEEDQEMGSVPECSREPPPLTLK